MSWEQGVWRNPPAKTTALGDQLSVVSGDKTDMWRTTSYGFIHDSGHSLLTALPEGRAMEIDLRADYDQQFDQAGLLVWAAEDQWTKCGLEYVDGVTHLGAVVTRGESDWSAAPVPDWTSGVSTFRVSRLGDALTIRARRPGEDWQLVRVAPLDPLREWQAGPYVASPSRAGLRVDFLEWRLGNADKSLH